MVDINIFSLHFQDLTFWTRSATAGYLKLNWNGQIGTICNRSFTEREAMVACRQMGKHGGKISYHRYPMNLDRFQNKIWLSHIKVFDSNKSCLF